MNSRLRNKIMLILFTFLSIFLVLSPLSVLLSDDQVGVLAMRGETIDALNSLSSLDVTKEDRFIAEWGATISLISSYLENKRKVCSGEVPLNHPLANTFQKTSIQNIPTLKILSDSEKKFCFQDLRNLEIRFIEAAYLIQKKYRDYLYKKRDEELLLIKKEMIEFISKGGEQELFKNYFSTQMMKIRGK